MKPATAFTWEYLNELSAPEIDRINGPTNAYSSLRLFKQNKDQAKVTLYRDHHAWCPYCQKVWLWLELKQIPYKIKKVTMRCYGTKESWYTNKVASGMLPAIEIGNKIITESDQILFTLEKVFGPLGRPIDDNHILVLRELERKLFRSWCIWLCQPLFSSKQDSKRKDLFNQVAKEVEQKLKESQGPFLDSTTTINNIVSPGIGDVIFIPYIERMNASLTYYKGFNLREEYPFIDKWLRALELLDEYRGTQGDFHTHAHDLPPQMGGCWTSANQKQKQMKQFIDSGKGLGNLEFFTSTKIMQSNNFKAIALSRVIKHKNKLIELNPMKNRSFDQPLRAALTSLISSSPCQPDKHSASGLRYLRDRVSVPRDMPLLAARELRNALENTAQLDGLQQGVPIPTRNRLDQDPYPFKNQNQ